MFCVLCEPVHHCHNLEAPQREGHHSQLEHASKVAAVKIVYAEGTTGIRLRPTPSSTPSIGPIYNYVIADLLSWTPQNGQLPIGIKETGKFGWIKMERLVIHDAKKTVMKPMTQAEFDSHIWYVFKKDIEVCIADSTWIAEKHLSLIHI